MYRKFLMLLGAVTFALATIIVPTSMTTQTAQAADCYIITKPAASGNILRVELWGMNDDVLKVVTKKTSAQYRKYSDFGYWNVHVYSLGRDSIVRQYPYDGRGRDLYELTTHLFLSDLPNGPLDIAVELWSNNDPSGPKWTGRASVWNGCNW